MGSRVIGKVRPGLKPVVVDKGILRDYVGKFGKYEILLDEGVLYIHRENRPKTELRALSDSVLQWGENQYVALDLTSTLSTSFLT
jgi:hypothetical protein